MVLFLGGAGIDLRGDQEVWEDIHEASGVSSGASIVWWYVRMPEVTQNQNKKQKKQPRISTTFVGQSKQMETF